MTIDTLQPLDDDEIETLELFLQTLEAEDAVIGISELDGFLTAIVSGPNALPPQQWIQAIWGDEDGPAWESARHAEEIISLIIRHVNSISTALTEFPEDFDPIYMEDEFEGEPYLNVDEWCQGYLKGIQLDPEGWQQLDEEMEQALAPILVFGLDTGLDGMVDAEDAAIEALQQQVAPAARRLHAYWLSMRGATLQ
jgi:uncharacterized protein